MTVEELAREVVGSLDIEEGYLICQKWISRRYQELAARMHLRHLMQLGEVTVPGAYRTGTITVTKGSANVVGVGTAWTNALVGRFLRRANDWHEVLSVTDATHLTLKSPYQEATASGVSYHIVPRRVPMPAGVRHIEDFRNGFSGGYLELLGLAELDLRDPSRRLISNFTEIAAEIGVDNTTNPDVRLFEFYPYPQNDLHLSFTYRATPQEFVMSDTLPEVIDPGVLKEGVIIDAYRFCMAKALKEGRTDVAATWRNELRAQETTWKNKMTEAAQTDPAGGSGTVILRTNRGRGRGPCC